VSSSGTLDSNTFPPSAGSSTGSSVKFVAHTKPGSRTKASTPSGVSSQRSSAEPEAPSAACDRRSRSASRYSDSIEPGSPSCAETVNAPQSEGCGSHDEDVLNPYGGSSPDHGSGTRQPSRPISVPPDRSHTGS
jgi:hypothetical protein